MKTNFEIVNKGTVLAFYPISDTAKQWTDENLDLEPWQWWGDCFVLDHTPARAIIEAIDYELGGIVFK